MPPRVGVCSWSLSPESPEDLARKLDKCGVGGVQLALDPIRRGQWPLEATKRALADIELLSGMMAMRGEDYSTLDTIKLSGGVRPDNFWDENLAAAKENAGIAAELGIDLVTFHAGFIPEDPAEPLRAVMFERLGRIVDVFAERGVRVGLETGQETSGTLNKALDELARPGLGVNFDPANMILYGSGDPIAALRRLAPRVVQIHVKDAVASAVPGAWGREVPAGTGGVDWGAFFAVYHDAPLSCGLVIEREAGADRLADVTLARRLVERYVGKAL
jgi:L-ribulose-5-phosphate 3-epimerase